MRIFGILKVIMIYWALIFVLLVNRKVLFANKLYEKFTLMTRLMPYTCIFCEHQIPKSRMLS